MTTVTVIWYGLQKGKIVPEKCKCGDPPSTVYLQLVLRQVRPGLIPWKVLCVEMPRGWSEKGWTRITPAFVGM